MKGGVKSLYICYFGLREPLVQTQVLPYLIHLAKKGVVISLLTFEPEPSNHWSEEAIGSEKQKLKDLGIDWRFKTYHKRPSAPATLYDIFSGALSAAGIVRNKKIQVIHCRAHIPVAMGLLVRKLTGARLIFDIRGFMADEYADAGIWAKESLTYRIIKRLEDAGIRAADHIVVLTQRARNYLVEHKGVNEEKIDVVPCCVDLENRAGPAELKNRERFELVYAGSVTGLYLLPEMADFFLKLKNERKNAFFRILTLGDRSSVSEVFSLKGIEETDYSVEAVPPDEVLSEISRAHLAISFRKPTFAQIAASPTKIPEYLSAGVPVVTNAGIGDTDQFVEDTRTGVVVGNFEQQTLQAAVQLSLELVADESAARRCREAVKRNYSLETVGGPAYERVYEKLSANSGELA